MLPSMLVGKWTLLSWTNKFQNQLHYPFGERPSGWVEFSDGQFISYVKKDLSHKHGQLRLSTPFYDEQTMEFSASGIYKLDSDEITLQYLEASLPQFTNQKTTRTLHFDNHRTLILSGIKSINEGICSVSATYVKQA